LPLVGIATAASNFQQTWLLPKARISSFVSRPAEKNSVILPSLGEWATMSPSQMKDV
jgi:hypothetical protein